MAHTGLYSQSYLPPEPDNVRRFRELVSILAERYKRNNALYGDSFSRTIAKYGVAVALARLDERLNRATRLLLHGDRPPDDTSVTDTLRSLATYAIMLSMELEKPQHNNKKSMDNQDKPYQVTAICEAPKEPGLTLNEYQYLAMTTCMDSCRNESYMLLNLVGEVGELASKMAKAIRKGSAMINSNRFITECGCHAMTPQEIHDLKAEAGDCLWQIAGLCHVMGWSLQEIGDENIAKLADRRKRGVVDGNGDNR